MHNHEITDFQAEVIDRSGSVPVLVDFWAEWCGPCKVLGPILENLEQKNGGRWVLAKLDTDRNRELAFQYGIRGIPNVKLFVDGKVADEFTGALPEPMVVQWLERALPNRFRKDLQLAKERLEEGDEAGARRLLEEVIQRDRRNEEALALLANLIVASDPEKAAGLVSEIEEDSAVFPLVDSVRTLAALQQKLVDPGGLPDDPVREGYLEAIRSAVARNYGTALEQFIDVIRRNRYYDDDGSRKACIAIFRILGEDHEITQKYRRDFAGALSL